MKQGDTYNLRIMNSDWKTLVVVEQKAVYDSSKNLIVSPPPKIMLLPDARYYRVETAK
jgi:hypothetical protein